MSRYPFAPTAVGDIRFSVKRTLFRFLRLFGIIAMLGLAGCSTISNVPPRTTLSADRVVLPTWKGSLGLLYVDVKINGAGPFRLIVDSGCTRPMLASRVARSAGVRPMNSLRGGFRNADGVIHGASFGRVDRLECGGLVIEGLLVGIVPESFSQSMEPGSGADGAIGMSAFASVVLEIDIPSGQVAVSRPGARTFDPSRGHDCTPGTPVVVADVGGKPIRMLVDTGATGAFRVPSLEGLPLAGPRIKWTGAIGVVGTVSTARPEEGQLAGEIRLAGIQWNNPPLSTTVRDRGRIGLEALEPWTVVFDQPGRKLYLLGTETAWSWTRLPELPGKAVGLFMVMDGQHTRVMEVDPGGAAERAGLKAGDVIIGMDGNPGRSPEFMTKPTRLQVRRGDTEFETVLEIAPVEPAAHAK